MIMNLIRKIFEFGYLAIGLLSLVEAVLRWHSNQSKALIFLGFAILAVLMFFFKRRFRKKLESSQKNKNNYF